MFTVYGVYLMIQYNPADYIVKRDPFIYLKKIYMSLLPIYTFYVFFREKKYSLEKVYAWVFILLFFASVQYFQFQREMMVMMLMLGSDSMEFTNNMGYLFLSIIPACVFLYKKPLIQYVVLGYCTTFILFGMKRGAVIICVFCLFWFLWVNIKNANIRKKIFFIFLSVFLCIFIYSIVQKQLEDSFYFQRRIEQTMEGNSSGRDKLYDTFADYFWNKTNPLQFVFGSGADATLKVSVNYAHNDWLEIAVNQGVGGLMVYILFWAFFAKELFSKNYRSQEKMALQLLFLIYFTKSFISMSYYEMSTSATFALGYCFAQKKTETIQQN
jgi:hypothetical protein